MITGFPECTVVLLGIEVFLSKTGYLLPDIYRGLIIPPGIDYLFHQFAFSNLIGMILTAITPQVVPVVINRANLFGIAIDPCSIINMT